MNLSITFGLIWMSIVFAKAGAGKRPTCDRKLVAISDKQRDFAAMYAKSFL